MLLSNAIFRILIFAITWSILVPIAPIITISLLLSLIAKLIASSVSVKSFSGFSSFIFIFSVLYFSKTFLSIESKSPSK